MNHTKEPWRVDKAGHILNDKGHIQLASAWAEEAWDGHEDAIANAERIVACVNACAGVPNDKLYLIPGAFKDCGFPIAKWSAEEIINREG